MRHIIAKSRILMLLAAAAGMAISLIAFPAGLNNQTGTTKEPAMTVTCTAEPDKITKDMANSVVTITTTVEQKIESPLTYTWSATAGAKVSGTDSVVTVDAADLRIGLYIVKVKVDDEKKNSATCRVTFSVVAASVVQKPNNCPTVKLSAEPQVVELGANTEVKLHADAKDDDGDKLTYKWTADKGEIRGGGDTVTIDTANLESGNIRVTVTASDGKCQINDSVIITKK